MIKDRKLILFSVTIFSAMILLSSSGGTDFAVAGAPSDTYASCIVCHSGSGGSVTLTGAPATYSPGVTYPLTLTVNGDITSLKGGFQIVATNGITNAQVGTFSTISGVTRLTSSPANRLVQATPLDLTGGSGSWNFNWTAPSTGMPSNIRFYYAGNAANGNGGPDGGDFGSGGSTGLIPLPVELTRFAGRIDGSSVQLSWQTASEQNSDQFIVTRSTDNRNFEPIGQLNAAGNSNDIRNYTFTDARLPTESQLYYRLEQVDLDGTMTPSRIISLQQANGGTSVRLLDGNPIAWQGSVRFTIDGATPAHYARLLSIDGRLLGETSVNPESEMEIFVHDNAQKLCLLQVIGADQTVLHTERIVRF
jgi:hypothetical protein